MPPVKFTFACRCLIATAGLVLGLWGGPHHDRAPASAQTRDGGQAAPIEALVRAYPAFLERIDGNALVWKDGSRMVIDDGRGVKPFAERLDAPDIKDMFLAPYPIGPAVAPGKEIDPGRVRYAPLFDKMYGDCRTGGVQANLADVVWLPTKWGRKVQISKVNGVAEQLAKVGRELDALPPTFNEFLFPAAGTFVCRAIAGTKRQSVHGHGIAIDIALKHAHYWQWTQPASERFVWRNKIPMEIVEIFEKHGFIWGGRWYHYDTMHFEYRPELLPQR
ncbi:MAG: M15 family metallopeptidase [Hyphomicrobiaceae bacterium]